MFFLGHSYKDQQITYMGTSFYLWDNWLIFSIFYRFLSNTKNTKIQIQITKKGFLGLKSETIDQSQAFFLKIDIFHEKMISQRLLQVSVDRWCIYDSLRSYMMVTGGLRYMGGLKGQKLVKSKPKLAHVPQKLNTTLVPRILC